MKLIKQNPKISKKINEMKNWFFAKINKIEKILIQMREKTQISKVRNEGGIKTNYNEIQKSQNTFFKNLHSM